jgi:hypothetical protein
MTQIREIELDVLKPHLPNVLEFSEAIADLGPDYEVLVDVVQMDEKTETLVVMIKGHSLNYPRIEETIRNLGGSIHSIDKCHVVGQATQ